MERNWDTKKLIQQKEKLACWSQIVNEQKYLISEAESPLSLSGSTDGTIPRSPSPYHFFCGFWPAPPQLWTEHGSSQLQTENPNTGFPFSETVSDTYTRCMNTLCQNLQQSCCPRIISGYKKKSVLYLFRKHILSTYWIQGTVRDMETQRWLEFKESLQSQRPNNGPSFTLTR